MKSSVLLKMFKLARQLLPQQRILASRLQRMISTSDEVNAEPIIKSMDTIGGLPSELVNEQKLKKTSRYIHSYLPVCALDLCLLVLFMFRPVGDCLGRDCGRGHRIHTTNIPSSKREKVLKSRRPPSSVCVRSIVLLRKGHRKLITF